MTPTHQQSISTIEPDVYGQRFEFKTINRDTFTGNLRLFDQIKWLSCFLGGVTAWRWRRRITYQSLSFKWYVRCGLKKELQHVSLLLQVKLNVIRWRNLEW